jgi:membrane-associated phospholipid phosphatase
LAISTLVPALGSAKSFGYPYPWEPVVAALRGDGPSAPLPLMGIVSFPSFHTAMAIAYTCAYRRLKILLAPAAVLNLLMLAAVPFSGDHYVCDMLGGAAVALCALAVAHRAQRGGLAASRAAHKD